MTFAGLAELLEECGIFYFQDLARKEGYSNLRIRGSKHGHSKIIAAGRSNDLWQLKVEVSAELMIEGAYNYGSISKEQLDCIQAKILKS